MSKNKNTEAYEKLKSSMEKFCEEVEKKRAKTASDLTDEISNNLRVAK